jgi:hypothetical protein
MIAVSHHMIARRTISFGVTKQQLHLTTNRATLIELHALRLPIESAL